MVFVVISVFLLLALLGVPISFSMAAASIIWLLITGMPVELFVQQISAGVSSFPFLAIPLFILAGNLMDTGGMANRLVNLARGLVGHFRGGLGMVVVVSEILFSGISGSSIADASAMSSLLLPAMDRARYPRDKSVCIIAAASAMGILIPPCLTMIVLGGISNVSIAALFVAGFLPGFCLALVLMGLHLLSGQERDCFRKGSAGLLPRSSFKLPSRLWFPCLCPSLFLGVSWRGGDSNGSGCPCCYIRGHCRGLLL